MITIIILVVIKQIFIDNLEQLFMGFFYLIIEFIYIKLIILIIFSIINIFIYYLIFYLLKNINILNI